MPKIILTANLKQYFPEREMKLDANSIISALREMDKIRPRFSSYILEDDGHVRKHVNIFVNGHKIDKNNTNMSLASNGIAR
jgi:sulfur-carrier protein